MKTSLPIHSVDYQTLFQAGAYNFQSISAVEGKNARLVQGVVATNASVELFATRIKDFD